MKQVVIENPIINSAFSEPKRHFRFDDEGITSDIVEARRISHYFIPIAKPKKKGKAAQLELDLGGEWTSDRVEENKFINRVRERVSLWRRGGHLGVTPTTRRLLEYWTNPERELRLYFCQIEALETVIYISEVAKKYGDVWIENDLRRFNENANPLLFRMACKMATGSGKTVVMSMLIAWHTLNKIANPQNRLFRGVSSNRPKNRVKAETLAVCSFVAPTSPCFVTRGSLMLKIVISAMKALKP